MSANYIEYLRKAIDKYLDGNMKEFRKFQQLAIEIYEKENRLHVSVEEMLEAKEMSI